MEDLIKNIRLNKWHFYLLGLILINFGTGLITGYRLNQNLTFILKLVLMDKIFDLYKYTRLKR